MSIYVITWYVYVYVMNITYYALYNITLRMLCYVHVMNKL